MMRMASKDAEKAKMASIESQETNREPPFDIEKIPAKTILVPTLNPTKDVNAFVHHTGKFITFLF